ncbi:MAG TPA: hypothetical protein VMF29_09680 [Candidatus Edwardsbacteria bacterium]|nr:hypothetical protein [Candidatus Edwardsbacteria bacterium]
MSTISKMKPLSDRVIVKPLEPKEVKKGDKILYGKYSGTEVRIDDVEYLIMHVEDIMAVIHDEK